MEQIELLPSQIVVLEQQLENLKKEKRTLLADMSGVVFLEGSGTFEISDTMDSKFFNELGVLEQKINELTYLLNHSKVLEEYNEDKVTVGTVFTATLDFDGEMETDEYVLVNTREGKKELKAIPITPESEFGKCIVDKKVGDTFSYYMNDLSVVGFIEGIATKEELGIQKVR